MQSCVTAVALWLAGGIRGDGGSNNNKGDDVSDAILSFYDALGNAMYVADADKTRLGNVRRADTTPGLQSRKTKEDAEDDETKRRRCIYSSHSALRTTRARGVGQVRVSLIRRYATELVTGDAASYDEKDSPLYSPSSKPSISRNLTVQPRGSQKKKKRPGVVFFRNGLWAWTKYICKQAPFHIW